LRVLIIIVLNYAGWNQHALFSLWFFPLYLYDLRCISNLLKSWIKQRKSIIAWKIRIIFLKACIQHSIIPFHLQNIVKIKLNLFNHQSNIKLNHLRHNFALKLLKIELNDAYRSQNQSKMQIFRLVSKISRHLSEYIYMNFFKSQESSLFSLFTQK